MKLKNSPTGYLGLFLTIAFSLYFIFSTFGLAFIDGSSDYWVAESRDLTQHLSGLNMYLSCQWQFPLLSVNCLNYPEGTSVTFVDGLPLYAFLLKVFLPRNIGYISPLGYWVGLSFLLQGIAAWWITRELNIKSWAFLLFLILIFLTYPSFIGRLKHIALMSHWILLFSIALYLRGNRLKILPMKGWVTLLLCSFYIHIYLFAMALGIYVAAVLEAKHKMTARHMCSMFLPIVILGASLFLFLLPLPNSLHGARGFNIYAMNLLSPIYGGKLIQLQANFSHAPNEPNYLGLGVILLLLWAFFTQLLKNGQTFKKHWAFFTVMLGYFLYSLSDTIYFGGNLIATVHYPHFLDPITTQLRASGRFFWPVGYMIIIVSLYQLYSQMNNKRAFTFLCCTLLLIQFFDIHDRYKELRNQRYRPPQLLMNYDALDKILGKKIKYIYLHPTCDAGPRYAFHALLPIERYASMRQLKLNTGFISRYGSRCHDIKSEMAQSVKSESAYIFLATNYPTTTQIYNAVGKENKLNCSRFTLGYICLFNENAK